VPANFTKKTSINCIFYFYILYFILHEKLCLPTATSSARVGELRTGPASATSGAPARRGAASPALLPADELLGRRAAAYRDPPRPARRRSGRGPRGQARGATACARSWLRSSRAPAPAWPELGSSNAHAPALMGVTDGGVLGAAEPALVGGLASVAGQPHSVDGAV
jgi:hypothetical protein